MVFVKGYRKRGGESVRPHGRRKGKNKKTMFFAPVDKSLAKKIDTTSPTAFRGSIKELNKGGLSTKEERALILAENRAEAQTYRKNLSPEEREQFREIANTPIPRKD